MRPIAIIVRDVLAIGLVTLVLAEASLRIYDRIQPSFVFYSTSYERYRGKPFSVDNGFPLNSKGFKDVEFEGRKAPGMYRILGIGDSFAYGVVPYPSNFLTLLEEGLKGSGQIEVVNMGIPNTGPRDYLSLFAREGRELAPDLVIVCFFIGNDFAGLKAKRPSDYSYVAALVRFLMNLYTNLDARFVPSRRYDDDVPTLTDEAYLAIERDRSYVVRKDSPDLAAELPNAVAYLAATKRLCDGIGSRFVVVFIPDELQIDRQLQLDVVRTLGATEGDFDFARPNAMLAAALDGLGIDHVDLLDGFLAAAPQGRLYKPRDSHWNIAGNALAADLIRKSVETTIAK